MPTATIQVCQNNQASAEAAASNDNVYTLVNVQQKASQIDHNNSSSGRTITPPQNLPQRQHQSVKQEQIADDGSFSSKASTHHQLPPVEQPSSSIYHQQTSSSSLLESVFTSCDVKNELPIDLNEVITLGSQVHLIDPCVRKSHFEFTADLEVEDLFESADRSWLDSDISR